MEIRREHWCRLRSGSWLHLGFMSTAAWLNARCYAGTATAATSTISDGQGKGSFITIETIGFVCTTFMRSFVVYCYIIVMIVMVMFKFLFMWMVFFVFSLFGLLRNKFFTMYVYSAAHVDSILFSLFFPFLVLGLDSDSILIEDITFDGS